MSKELEQIMINRLKNYCNYDGSIIIMSNAAKEKLGPYKCSGNANTKDSVLVRNRFDPKQTYLLTPIIKKKLFHYVIEDIMIRDEASDRI